MPKKKLIHFRENLTFPFLFQPTFLELRDDFRLRSKWNSSFFNNDNPIVLEAGCGKGEYTVGLARNNQGKNYVGIDIKGARLWRGCRTVKEESLKNVAFIRTLADHMEKLFAPGEISEVWITFPDPQPMKNRRKFTSPWFLEKFRNILVPGGTIHLKTDNEDYYNFTLEVIGEEGHILLQSTSDLFNSGISGEIREIRTFYENMWLAQGKNICYLSFQLGSL
ncbi:MAG: tRNA (guanosine(46)-N7)-methyltransferase TrmB [bacterium]